MKLKTILIISIIIFKFTNSYSQSVTAPDTAKKRSITLNEVVISANKTEEIKKNIAQQVEVLNASDINNAQAQSSADLISNSGTLFVQKSQLGGGSPVIRGFEASRILLVIDGVRMNNIIYRAGHLQNIVTTDNAILDRAEILFGPASTVYGSDALGGVISLYTKKPILSSDKNKIITGINAFSRYGSVDNEVTGHIDFNIGTHNFASLTSLTYSNFDDLKSGENQNPFYSASFGDRPYYVKRFNGKDSLVKNSNRYIQKQSAYSQLDIMQKFLYKQSDHVSHSLNFQFSNSSDVPRYDRLTDPKGNGLKFAEWYYGPQQRLMTAYDLNIDNTASFFQDIHLNLNYQNIEESRHNRKFGNNNLAHNIEKVNVLGANLELQRSLKEHNIRIGIDAQYNSLKSTANNENIVTGESSPIATRYPDGDNNLTNAALYFSHTWQITKELVLNDGLRFGFSSLHSTFNDTTFFRLPYSSANQTYPVYSGSIGLINNVSDNLKLSLLLSTGYRVPNVDDLSKVFESAPGDVIVPNSDLKPEKTINYELGITRIFGQKTLWENNIYYTRFYDAIVTDKFTLNGKDSVMYDGTLSRVLANQNKKEAYIYGFSSSIRTQCTDNLFLSAGINYTFGRIKTDSSDYPLDHIPPFIAHLQLTYTNHNFSSDFFINYNGWKRMKNYNLEGEDNEAYATPEGMPAWYTVNIRASYKITKILTLQAGVDNIFDTQYRTFASGINAPGRNIFACLRLKY